MRRAAFYSLAVAASLLFAGIAGAKPCAIFGSTDRSNPLNGVTICDDVLLAQLQAPVGPTNIVPGTPPIRLTVPDGPLGAPPVVVQQAPAPTVIDTGTLAGQALTWMITVFGGVIATYATMLIRKLLKKAGVDLSDAQSQKLDAMILNGLHAAAPRGAQALAGRGTIDVKSQTIASMVTYVQAHGAETLKALGAPDPNDPKVIEALRARAERLIADPTVSTPEALGGPSPTATVAVGGAPGSAAAGG